MTLVKTATLGVIVKADDVVVAEARDLEPEIWREILKAIDYTTSDRIRGKPTTDLPRFREPSSTRSSGDKDAAARLDRFAQKFQLDRAAVQTACSPANEPPYMRLDPHCWEAMKARLRKRGTTAVAPIAASATLLAFWFGELGLGNPTQSQAQAVLKTIDWRDKNASRGIQRARWLRTGPGGQVLISAAEISRAKILARCFCSKDWTSWNEFDQTNRTET